MAETPEAVALRDLLALMIKAQPHANAVFHRNSPCCNPAVFTERLQTIHDTLTAPPSGRTTETTDG